jgi:hypothetical protein
LRLRVEDIALLLEHVAIPDQLAVRLRRAPVELEISDDDIAALNDTCIAYIQEHATDAPGSGRDIIRRVEGVVDALNAH